MDFGLFFTFGHAVRHLFVVVWEGFGPDFAESGEIRGKFWVVGFNFLVNSLFFRLVAVENSIFLTARLYRLFFVRSIGCSVGSLLR